MDQGLLAAYDRGRDLSNKSIHSLCYAPTLRFDTSGNAWVCCRNHAHLAGNILKASLDDIWSDARINVLRAPLERIGAKAEGRFL
jgi:hypothetical protein